MSINRVILMGRITADLEMRMTSSGKDVLSFSLAVDRGWGESKKTDFITCVAWEQTARFIYQYFGKGRLIGIEGSLQTRSYEDKSGNKRVAVEVLVEKAHFTGEKAASSAPDVTASSAYRAPRSDDYQEIEEDEGDIPF